MKIVIEFLGEYSIWLGSENMNLKKYPQYMLYKFTQLLNLNKEKFQKPYTGKRAVNSTIINRAYYSAYSYALLWLEERGFKPKQKWEFEADREEYESEHRQVRNALKIYGKMNAHNNLYELHELRKKADYKLFNPLTEDDVKDSIKHMENIFEELEFKK